MWQDGTAASAEEDSDRRQRGFSWFVCGDCTDWWFQCENVTRRLECAHTHTQKEVAVNNPKSAFFVESLREDVSRCVKCQFRVDPCLSWFYQGHSSFASSAYKVFSYLEDGSQWTATCPEVYDVHTGAGLASLWFFISFICSLRSYCQPSDVPLPGLVVCDESPNRYMVDDMICKPGCR